MAIFSTQQNFNQYASVVNFLIVYNTFNYLVEHVQNNSPNKTIEFNFIFLSIVHLIF